MLLCLALAGAQAPAWASSVPAASSGSETAPSAATTVPNQAPQGGLLLGSLPGARELLLQSAGGDVPVRLADDGGFVIGVGRDEVGPLRLRARWPDGAQRDWQVVVRPRAWRFERIEGVPESTVNPPPAIAARIQREQAEVSAARVRDDPREDYASGFDWPVRGRVSGVYGSQRIYNGTPKSPHSGLDVAVPAGTPIHAPAAGVVTFARPDLYLTGGTVLLDHGHGLSSNFLHMSQIDVKVGQQVAKGEVIGQVGMTGRATGPHMHWGMNWFSTRIDPALLLPASDPAAAAAAAPLQ
ncbi:M23 family metallopeptidase [soil metagenome]